MYFTPMEGFCDRDKIGNKKKDSGRRKRPYFVPDGFEEVDASSESQDTFDFAGNIGADDLKPFGSNEDLDTEKRHIKGMVPTPEDIWNIHRPIPKNKNIKPKDTRKPPFAGYDPTEPFDRSPSPDPDHERPHK
ncbi:hypothetical protein PAEPH01_1629 [Pancytospora epiphaga]|nr:hypothetical protein PAEPH01_1629 [Pancytospora epiphaga]